MNERERGSTPRAVGRRTLLRSSAVVGVIGLAGCMQPLLEEGDAAADGEPTEVTGDDESVAPGTDGESGDALRLEPAWGTDLVGSSVMTHDGQFLTQVGERQLTGLDVDGEVQWQATALDTDDHSYALPGVGGDQDGVSLVEDVLYVGTISHGDHAGRVYAYEYDDGSIRFEHEPDESLNIRHLAGTGDGVVYHGTDPEDDVWLLRALEDDGETRWTTRLEDDSDAPLGTYGLVAGEGTVLMVDNVAAGIYDLADGSLAGTVDFGDPVVRRRGPSSDESQVYLRTDNGDRLTVLERSAFDVAWEQDLVRSAVSPTALADGVLYAGSEGGFVHAYDAADGTLLWESPQLAGRLDARPTVGEFVWVTDDLGTIYALERDDGTVRYQEDYRDGLDASTAYDEITIAALDGTVLIGESGQAYRVESP